MRSRLFLAFATLLIAAMLLGACSSVNDADSSETSESKEAELSEKDTPATPISVDEGGEAYPSSGENTEIYIPVSGGSDDSADAYPAPDQPGTAPDTAVILTLAPTACWGIFNRRIL